MTRLITLLFCFFLISCASPIKRGPYPVNSDDFTLPPEELLEKFPVVATFHKKIFDKNLEAINYDELHTKWGKPDSTTKRFGYTTGFMSALVLVMSVENGVFYTDIYVPMLLSAGLMDYYLSPIEERWRKGEYNINVLSSHMFSMDTILGWDWYYKNNKNSIVTPKWLKYRRDHPWFFELGFHGGGEKVSIPGYLVDAKYGDGANLGLGRQFFIKGSGWDVDVSLVWNNSSVSGQNVRYSNQHYALNIIPMRRMLDNSFRFGFGPTIVTKSRIKMTGGEKTELIEHKNSIGAMAKFEYIQYRNQGMGLFIRYLELERKTGGIDRSESIGVFFRF